MICRRLLVFILLVGGVGCSPAYLFHVTTGQMRILEKKEPISEVIRENKLSSQKVAKLKLVEEARQFSFHELHLDQNDNYTEYVPLDRNYVAMNMVVCPKDSLEAKTWWFPFTGHIGYLGFFNIDYARDVEEDYKHEGYDTYVRGVSAYSTLGWFDDPVFSTMLEYREDTLVNTIIHELVHATIFKKGETEFNEGIATFIGNMGTRAFLTKKYGANSKHHQWGEDDRHDSLIFSRFLKKTRKDLEAFYKRGLSRNQLLVKRETEFYKVKREFYKIKSQFKTDNYSGFDKLKLNNAVIAGFGQYYEDLSLFEKVWHAHGKNFKRTLDVFKRAEEQDDAMAYLRRLVL